MDATRVSEISVGERVLRTFKRRSEDDWPNLLTEIDGLLKQSQAINNEELSNEYWYLHQFCFCCANYVECFHLMQVQHFYEAWCKLEIVENTLNLLRSNRSLSNSSFNVDDFIDLIAQWQSLFPYRIFISPEIIVKKFTCSICGLEVNPWSACVHRKGNVYNGRLCFHLVQDMDFLGTAFVRKPVQKYSVPFLCDENGQTVDQYDYSCVAFVVERLDNPFDGWSVEWTYANHSHKFFADRPHDGACPCESGRSYSSCCLSRDGVKRPHMQIGFEKQPDRSLPTFIYTGYGNGEQSDKK